jgi:hypothetical protein
VISDRCGVPPPDEEDFEPDCLAVSPFGMLTKRAWNVVEENECEAKRKCDKNNSGINSLVRVVEPE